jgi:hypothetical protein
MTLYTNLKPLFEPRKNSAGDITEYLYVGMQFYRLYDNDAWFKRMADKRFHYHDTNWSGENKTLVPVNTSEVTETHFAQCMPDFLCQVMEDDVLFPSILPDSQHFDKVPEKFYGLALRDVQINETIFDAANSSDWFKSLSGKPPRMQIHECVELLVDKEKFICFKSDLVEIKT